MNSAERAFAAMYEQLKSDLRAELRAELLNDMQTAFTDRRMSMEEAAQYLSISKDTVQRLCKQKVLPHVSLGVPGSRKPRILISLSALDEWIRQKERESVAQ